MYEVFDAYDGRTICFTQNAVTANDACLRYERRHNRIADYERTDRTAALVATKPACRCQNPVCCTCGEW